MDQFYFFITKNIVQFFNFRTFFTISWELAIGTGQLVNLSYYQIQSKSLIVNHSRHLSRFSFIYFCTTGPQFLEPKGFTGVLMNELNWKLLKNVDSKRKSIRGFHRSFCFNDRVFWLFTDSCSCRACQNCIGLMFT